SIFATLDWLDPISFASSPWVICCCSLVFLNRALRASFISTSSFSAAVSPRNSLASPTAQPAFSSRLFLVRSISVSAFQNLVVGLQSLFTHRNHPCWRRPGRLREDLRDHNGVCVHPVHHTP